MRRGLSCEEEKTFLSFPQFTKRKVYNFGVLKAEIFKQKKKVNPEKGHNTYSSIEFPTRQFLGQRMKR